MSDVALSQYPIQEVAMRSRFAVAALVALAIPAVAGAQAVTWKVAPPAFPPGARMAVKDGDPTQNAQFTVLFTFPDGYVIPPHFHPTDEHITVMSGKFMVGMGDAIDTTQATVLMTGGQITAHANQHHYAVARGLTTVQVEAMGPFKLTYVDPKNDPRNAPKTK
jgi:quercetin dioxygenase-like cupin family protein